MCGIRGMRRLLCFAALAAYVSFAAAASPGATSLRLETGTHLAPVRAIATDSAGKFLVTASEDKSARVWEPDSGRLLQVFRPPSAESNEGKLFAVSMLPDGSLFATGGWSANNDVYLVQRGNGNGDVRQRITGLPNVVTSLAFSPDGKMLAVGLWGEHGLRLFVSEDGWKSSYERTGDSDVGGDIQALAWSPAGDRLASSSSDGAIRLYQPTANGLKLLQRKPPNSRALPYGLAFSPNGKALAVGSINLPEILIIDSSTLMEQSKIVAAEGPPVGGWSSIAWANEETVVAGGSRRSVAGDFTVCVAKRSGTRCDSEPNVARNTMTGLVRLGEGRVAYAAADPAWGVVAGDGTLVRSVVAEISDFRQMRKSFRLAPDGSGVVVRSKAEKAELGQAFDLRQVGWRLPARDWTAPAARVGKLAVDAWFEQSRPRIGARVLALEPNELALTATVSAAADRVVLGTSFFLRSYDQTGRELWRTPIPGTTWQVNLSADGRWLVAGFSDGTLRWYRMRDGKEQIAVFPHPDAKRWIAWTPQGYYATSPGGEDLLGWQQEQGPGKGADFFPASRLRSQFYRPDIVEKTFELLDETAAVTATSSESGRKAPVAPVAQLLPPVIQIVFPATETTVTATRMSLRYTTRSPHDAPVSALRVRVNGQLVKVTDSRTLADPAGEMTEIAIPIPDKDSEIQLFAENRNGVSTPAVVRVNWQGAKPAPSTALAVPAEDVLFKPKLYVLAVGVTLYANPAYNLGLAAKDATDFSNILQGQKGALYGDVTVRLLTDNKATKDDVLDGLEWLKRQVTARDVGIMFLAGHGMNDNTGKYFFMPHNADPAKLLRTGVAQSDIKDTLNSLAGKAVFFVDTCHSGNALGTAKTRSMTSQVDAFINELASAENGVVVFTAATGKQLSQENDEWGNGAFTKAVVEGISGKADFGKTGRITHKGLDFYVSERVKQLTDGTQSPVSIAPMGITDFPIAVVKPAN
jgi:WD40 repeat protein